MNIFNKIRGKKSLKEQLNSQAALIEEQARQLEEASGFIKQIEKGNFDISISDSFQQNELGNSLLSMQKHFSKIASEEEERNWLTTGLAQFSDILRNKDGLDLQQLADDILKNLVRYVGANQGAIFTLEDDVAGDEHLQIVACYAYSRKKFVSKKILLGEGLAGQCVLERETIYMTEIPESYINITSGLGSANPRSVLISPLLINDKIFGVIELASFTEFPTYKREFINRLSENIASSIKNEKDNGRMRTLLQASQEQSEELRAQEEEMRQNMEEMQATQEEMARKNEEIARAAAEAESVLQGINATMATIEFTPDGIIEDANDNFLKSMKTTMVAIKGKHHRNFVPADILTTDEYSTFWSRLALGESISGNFRRVNAVGETVWLNAIYNPIFDASGKVVKVIKFATDITVQQEMLAENKGILKGIDSTMATIEFTPEGTVLNANDNFLKVMKFTSNDIKGKHHRTFVPKEMLNSEEYKLFWDKLAAGTPAAGVFERISSNGDTVWLNAVYNPILNASGVVTKVVKFATDITKERELELR